jgi:hypothetical protein
MRARGNPIRGLKLANVLDDRRNLFLGDLRLRRHVSKTPMMLANTKFDGDKECAVGVVAGIVDNVHKWWTLVCPGCIRAVAGRTIGVKTALPRAAVSESAGTLTLIC